MEKKRIHLLLSLIILCISLTAGCTLPGFSTPTPFSFPTPDQTMTALFEPTSAAPATSVGDGGENDGGEVDPVSAAATATAAAALTATAQVTATETPTPTEEITPTFTPTDPDAGPSVRSGPSITATKLSSRPGIDGDLYEWNVGIQKVINKVVYGANKWTGENDASGTVVAGWDNEYLFLGFRVKDDKYIQKATGSEIYLGDSVEILFDADVSGDYYNTDMNSDDFQIGISPGKNAFAYVIQNGKLASLILISPTDTPKPTSKPACSDCDPQAYIWYPVSKAGKTSEIKIGALESGKGYQVELRIPWDLLGVTPQRGDHYGFALSISDNDRSGAKDQQSMVSNVSTRYFADPTTWGDLFLE